MYEKDTSSPAGVVVMAEKDVTSIKVQRDAKLMEARFRDLLESTPDGIVMANATGHIVIANSQAESLFGYSAGQLRGVLVDQLLPERFRQAHVGHRSGYFLQPRFTLLKNGGQGEAGQSGGVLHGVILLCRLPLATRPAIRHGSHCIRATPGET